MEFQFVTVDGRPIGRAGSFDASWMEDEAALHGVDEEEQDQAGVDADGLDEGVDSGQDYEVLLRPKGKRIRKHGIPASVMEAVERQELTQTETILTPLGDREFPSFAVAHEAIKDEYEVENCLHYRIRDSAKVATYNATAAKLKTKTSDPVPDEMEFGTRTYRCIHGLYQAARGTGERCQKKTKYTACDGKIVLKARRSSADPSKWVVKVVSEVVRHNHKCSSRLYDSYTSSSVLARDEDLFKDLHLMLQVSASTRRIRDVVRMRYGVRLTAQQIANFMRDRLGGRSSVANVRLLLQRFSSFEGSRCLVIEDEDGLVCGIVMQSRAQRLMLDRYGDNLILDWTHNTNNAGYYLGALMATSASGSGVSVLDFICLTQSKAMMKTIFEHFISWNPGARDKIRSFVIDKDYAEWSVLKEVFPKSRVLFCQFHVIKWLVQVLHEGRYGNLSAALQDTVVKILRLMVYAPSAEAFDQQKWLLEHVLADACPEFLRYMDARWYSCVDMWSDFLRSSVFTATNSTSNRIESSWGQVKSILGLKLRFDMCLEAIFTYETAVLEREIECLEAVVGPSSLLRSKSDPFLRPVVSQVSDYCADHVEGQYKGYLRMLGNCLAHEDPAEPGRVVIEKFVASGSHRVVKTTDWSCSCLDFVSTELPCRHMMFVSRVHCKHERLPLAVLRPRWMLYPALSMLPALRECADQLQSLRTGLLLVEPGSLVPETPSLGDDEDGVDDDLAFMTMQSPKSGRPPSAVAHVKLARGEVATGVVLDNMEKRNVVQAEFQQIQAFMMAQSTPRFKTMAAYLRDMLDGLLTAFREIPLTDRDRLEEAVKSTMTSCELTPQQQINAMVLSWVDVESTDASRPAAVGDHVTGQYDTALYDTGHLSARTSCPLSLHGFQGDQQQQQRVESSRDCGVTSGPELLQTRAVQQQQQLAESSRDCGVTSGPELPPYRRSHHGSGSITSIDLNDGVSSLGMSAASVILQGVAEHYASEPGREHPTTNRLQHPQRCFLPLLPHIIREKATVSAATKRSAATAHLDEGILDKIVLRMPMSKGTTKTQKARAKLKGSRRTATVTQRSVCAVDVDVFVKAARSTRGVATVLAKLQAYPVLFEDAWIMKRPVVVETQFVTASSFEMNFAIPAALQQRLEDAIKARKDSDPPPISYDLDAPPSSNQLVARIQAATTMRGFSDENVASIREFYTAAKSCRAYELDVAWASRHRESVPAGLREEVLIGLEQSALDTRFHLKANNSNPPTSIALHDVVGHLAGDVWLNDAVLVFVLRQIADELDGLFVLDSLRPMQGSFRPEFHIPTASIGDRQVVVFPVNVSESHWCLILCTVSAGGCVSVTYYDPFARQSNIQTLQHEWATSCEPFVRAWCLRDRGEYTLSASEIQTSPRQAADDGTNCGVYCIAATCDFASQSTTFRSMPTFDAEYVAFLRMWFLRNILCNSAIPRLESEVWANTIMERFTRGTQTTTK